MANEFKIKKGLIVTGASGGTVVDIQGSQGQLFSVTDDLSGSIFAVSDISGVPILDVNSSGLVTVDGPFTQTGGGDSNFSGDVNIKSVFDFDTATDLFSITNNQNTGGINLSGGNSRIYFGGNRAIEGAQNGTNLTFAEGYTTTYIQSNTIVQGTLAISATIPKLSFTDLQQDDWDIVNDNGEFKFLCSTGTGVALQLDTDNSATFGTQAFATTATSSGDASSTLTTKGYVDGLITGATIYRGAWDPSGGGYGSPDLSGVTQTSGYYYICSAAGTAEPNGTGTEPDTWAVGDWVIYNDVSGTGQWQKIDNSSVLSGVGTGQTVALWEGSGSVTDSETLGNAPITVSGNNSTFAGNVTVGALTSGETAQLIVNQEGGIAPVAKLMSRTNKAIVQISDNDTTGYVSSENGYFSLGSAAGVNAANINIATASSNVGIGVTATSDGDLTLNAPKLHVRGTDTSGAYNLVARFQGGNDADSTGAAILINHSNDRGLLIEAGRKDGDREVAYFNVISSGATVTPMLTMGKFGSAYNVGIGTTSPSSKLTVNGDARLANSGKLYLWNDHSINYLDYRTWTASSSAGMTIQNSAANGDILLLPNGNVGIGTTSPGYKLDVNGIIRSEDSSEVGTLYLGNTAQSQIPGGAIIGQRSSYSYTGKMEFQVPTWGANTDYGLTTQMTIEVNTPDTKEAIISMIPFGGKVGIGTTSPGYKLSVSGGIEAGGKITYSKSAGSLNTTGYAVAGLLASYNGQSACFTFTAIGNAGHYQKVVYSCWNTSGTWNTSKVIDEGTNGLDIEASVNASTITFTFKSRSGSLNYTPRVTVEASGSAINSTYA